MSHAVVRGLPTASQKYLDEILDAVIQEPAISHGVDRRDKLNMAQVIYYCMKLRPDSVALINGTTCESFTNQQMLERIVPLARALVEKGLKGKKIMIVMKNHEQHVTAYYAALFSGVTMFLLDPNSTQQELAHFLPLVSPEIVFCDSERVNDVRTAARLTDSAPSGVLGADALEALGASYSHQLEKFQISDASPKSIAVLLPTSGSTGLAKAALIDHKGLLAQVPNLWNHCTRFPRPTERAMFMSTAQWMTFTNMLTTCPIYDITAITAPKKAVEDVIRMYEQLRPTWCLLVPGFASLIASAVKQHQMTSLKTVFITGATPSKEILAKLKEKLPKSTQLCNTYGMTEAQGFVAVPDSNGPLNSIGIPFNIFHYKLVDDDDKEILEAGQNGELYLKSDYITKGYLNNVAAYQECMSTDGWWKTGDVFYKDENNNLHFVERKKFWFKYMNYHISPEELEALISTVPGVLECVACGTDAGAAAAVVLQPGTTVSRAKIHQAVDEAVMVYKRLGGGIAFVDSLPRTHSGKLHRTECTKLVNQLVSNGYCYH